MWSHSPWSERGKQHSPWSELRPHTTLRARVHTDEEWQAALTLKRSEALADSLLRAHQPPAPHAPKNFREVARYRV